MLLLTEDVFYYFQQTFEPVLAKGGKEATYSTVSKMKHVCVLYILNMVQGKGVGANTIIIIIIITKSSLPKPFSEPALAPPILLFQK